MDDSMREGKRPRQVITQPWHTSVDLPESESDIGQGPDERNPNPYKQPDVTELLSPEASPKIGVRAAVGRYLKIQMKPSSTELALRESARRVNDEEARNWDKINRDAIRSEGNCYYIAIGSEKGGVGKTTVVAGLAYTFALNRHDSIIVADANPDRGSLPSRFGVKPRMSIKDLVAAEADIPSKRGIREFIAKVPGSNISVLAGDNDHKRRDSTSADDITVISRLFSKFFSIGILDNGTGISHSAMEGSLHVGHSLALVIDNTNDAFEFTTSTLVYLEQSGYDDLRDRVVLVICDKISAPIAATTSRRGPKNDPTLDADPTSSTWMDSANITAVDIQKHFHDKVRDTVIIPYDPALAKSGRINFDELQAKTARAFRRLAATLSDDFIE